MNSETIEFAGQGAVRLAGRVWLPPSAPRGVVAIVHGITEHAGRYQHLADRLLQADVAVAAFDLRGHGLSTGLRGHLDRWEDLPSDLERFLAHLQSRFPGLPRILYGHSLGALVALAHVQSAQPQLAGLILSGTAIEPVGVAQPHLVAIARSLGWLWPRLRIPLPAPPRPLLSRDPEIEAEFRKDPLILKAVTARFGIQALAMIASVKRRAAEVRIPLLTLHGGADPLCRLSGVQRFFDQAASTDKRMIIYPDGLHEPHQDLDRERVFADLSEWISRRLHSARALNSPPATP